MLEFIDENDSLKKELENSRIEGFRLANLNRDISVRPKKIRDYIYK